MPYLSSADGRFHSSDSLVGIKLPAQSIGWAERVRRKHLQGEKKEETKKYIYIIFVVVVVVLVFLRPGDRTTM